MVKTQGKLVCKQPLQSEFSKEKNSRENIVSGSHNASSTLARRTASLDGCSLSDSSSQKDSMPIQVGFSSCFSLLGQETQEVLKRYAGWRQTCMLGADQVKEKTQFTPGPVLQAPGTLLRTVIASGSSWPVFKCQS